MTHGVDLIWGLFGFFVFVCFSRLGWPETRSNSLMSAFLMLGYRHTPPCLAIVHIFKNKSEMYQGIVIMLKVNNYLG